MSVPSPSTGISIAQADSRYPGPFTGTYVVTDVTTPTIAAVNAAIAQGPNIIINLPPEVISFNSTTGGLVFNGVQNVVFRGVQPGLNYTSLSTPDSGWTPNGGTWFQGDGTIPLVNINSVDQGSPPSNLTATAVTNISWEDIGFDAAPIIIGCANNLGLTYGHFTNCFFRRSPGWALQLTNAWDTRFTDCYWTGCFNAFYDRAALPTSSTETGHVIKTHCMTQIPNWKITVTPVSSTTGASCSTSDALNICSGFPVCSSTTTSGLTAWSVYYIVNYNQSAGTFGLATSVGGSPITFTANTQFIMECPSWLSQGFLVSCDTVPSTQRTNDWSANCQVNCQNRYHQMSQTVTCNGTTSISVPDVTQLAVGLPWDSPNGSSYGFTAGQMYVVQSITPGTWPAGTITVGNSLASAAITASGSGTMTMESYGFAPFEARTDSSTSKFVAFTALDIDSEGQAATGFMGTGLNQYNLTFQNFPTTLLTGICLRTCGTGTVLGTQGVTRDIDAASTSVEWFGSWSSLVQARYGYGTYLDNASGSVVSQYGINGPGVATTGAYDLMSRFPTNDGTLLAVGTALALPVTAGTSGGNLTAAYGNIRVLTGSGGSTINLPAIVSDQLGAANLKVANVGQVCLVENFTSGTETVQTFAYTLTVSGITVKPTVLSVYSNNSINFTTQATNLSGSAGSISGTITVTGSSAPTSSGTLTFVSGTGDATIAFSAEAQQAMNGSGGPTSATIPAGQSLFLVAERDSSGNLFWGAHLWNGSSSSAPYNIANFYSSIGNSGSTATTLYTASIPGGTLNANGQKLHALWSGVYTNNTNVKSLAVTFAGGSNFMPIGSSSLNVGGWQVEVWLQQSSSTSVAYTVKYTTQQSTGAVSATYAGYLTGLTLSNANTLLISGTGAATNDLYGYSGFIEWEP